MCHIFTIYNTCNCIVYKINNLVVKLDMFDVKHDMFDRINARCDKIYLWLESEHTMSDWYTIRKYKRVAWKKGKPVKRTFEKKRNVENLTEANLNSNRNSMIYQQCKTLLIFHVSVINFDRINFTLFYSENMNNDLSH